MNLKSTYNKIAEDWFKDHHDDTWWHEGVEKFLSAIPAGASILDVGCGAGVKTRYLTNKGFKVSGIDFSENMIGIAKRESPDLSFEVMDIYDLDTYQKTFDGVFVQAVLLHIPKKDIKEVLLKLKNKVKINGLLYISVKAMREDEIEEGVKKENDYGYDYERFFSYFSLSELKKYFLEVDLEIIFEMSTIHGRTEWLQIVGKKKD
jgi:2-polyprenyl-3-methyl-5-hydroxy-6-metoxy-1,4-benzoquinol methylase